MGWVIPACSGGNSSANALTAELTFNLELLLTLRNHFLFISAAEAMSHSVHERAVSATQLCSKLVHTVI